MTILKIDQLSVSVFGSCIIKDLSLEIFSGSLHLLMGPNGSGKSTLSYALAGHPRYEVGEKSMFLLGQDITKLSPDKRAKLGFFLAVQNPPEIPGVTVLHFLKEAYAACTGKVLSVNEFKEILKRYLEILRIDDSFLHRPLNENFSGGEKKRLEVLQLLVFRPKLAILDEIDSGLDIDALSIVCSALVQFREENPLSALILITHNPRMTQFLKPDHVHILNRGLLVRSGDGSLAFELELKGYDGILRC